MARRELVAQLGTRRLGLLLLLLLLRRGELGKSRWAAAWGRCRSLSEILLVHLRK